MSEPAYSPDVLPLMTGAPDRLRVSVHYAHDGGVSGIDVTVNEATTSELAMVFAALGVGAAAPRSDTWTADSIGDLYPE